MLLQLYKAFLFVYEMCQLTYNLSFAICYEIYNLFVKIPLKSVDCEIIVITGAGRGLGREIALYLIRFKPVLILWDIDKESVERLANEIRRRGGVAYPYEVDISDSEAVKANAKNVYESIGPVYMVINNAGILNCQKLLNLKASKIERTFKVNILSHFWTAKAFLPQMIDRRRGHIVAISSNRGLFGRAYFTDYSASKFAIIGFMQALDDELRTMEVENILFTTICPSAIDTGLSRPFETRFPSFLPIMDTDYAAKYIVDEVLKNKSLVIFPFGHRVLHFILRDCPRSIYNIIIDFVGYTVQPNPVSLDDSQ